MPEILVLLFVFKVLFSDSFQMSTRLLLELFLVGETLMKLLMLLSLEMWYLKNSFWILLLKFWAKIRGVKLLCRPLLHPDLPQLVHFHPQDGVRGVRGTVLIRAAIFFRPNWWDCSSAIGPAIDDLFTSAERSALPLSFFSPSNMRLNASGWHKNTSEKIIQFALPPGMSGLPKWRPAGRMRPAGP